MSDIGFRDCKEAIEFYLQHKVRGIKENGTDETGFIFNDSGGSETILNAIADIEKILSRFRKPVQRAFFAYVLDKKDLAISCVSRMTQFHGKGKGRGRITRLTYFDNCIRVLSQHLKKAGYLHHNYYAERDDIDELIRVEDENNVVA